MRALFYLACEYEGDIYITVANGEKHRKDYGDTVFSLVNSACHCGFSSGHLLDFTWLSVSMAELGKNQ